MAKRQSTKTDILKKGTLDALEKSLGVVTTACRTAGIHRSTFYDWYNNDENFRTEVDTISEIAIDFAESQLHKQIKDGSVPATIFYLKTKGKKRGYIERSEIEIEKPKYDLSKFNNDELIALVNDTEN